MTRGTRQRRIRYHHSEGILSIHKILIMVHYTTYSDFVIIFNSRIKKIFIIRSKNVNCSIQR